MKIKAKNCHFGDLTDELVCDRIVCGISNDSIRKTLLRDSHLTLAKAISICRMYEMTEMNTKALVQQQTATTIDAVQPGFNENIKRQYTDPKQAQVTPRTF